MAKFRQGHVVLKPGEKIRFDDQDVTDVSTDPSNDSTSVIMATSGIQTLEGTKSASWQIDKDNDGPKLTFANDVLTVSDYQDSDMEIRSAAMSPTKLKSISSQNQTISNGALTAPANSKLLIRGEGNSDDDLVSMASTSGIHVWMRVNGSEIVTIKHGTSGDQFRCPKEKDFKIDQYSWVHVWQTGTIWYVLGLVPVAGQVEVDTSQFVNNLVGADSTDVTLNNVQQVVEYIDQDLKYGGSGFISTPEEIILNSTKGIKGLLGVENTEFTEESSFEVTGFSAEINVLALPNGNIATLILASGDNTTFEINTPDGTQVAIYTVVAVSSDTVGRIELLQSGHIVASYNSGGQGKFIVFNQEGEVVVAETTPVTSEGGYVVTAPVKIQPLAGGKFMFYGHQYNVAARIAIYEIDGGSLNTIKQLFDITETSGITNIEESALLADGNIVFAGYNSVIAGRAMMIMDQNGVEVLQAVDLSVDSTDLQIKNLPSKRIAAFVRVGVDPWIHIYDYELNLINSLQLSANSPSPPYNVEVLQNGSIVVGWGDGITRENNVIILDENLNIEQTMVVSTSSTAAVYVHISAMYNGGFVALDYVNSNSNNVRIFTSSKTRINGSLGLATGEYVNEISNNPASDSTSAIMTTEAIQALVALPSGTAEFSVVDSDTAVATADGKKAFTVSAALNGLNLTAKVASVHSLSGDATGAIDIQIRRRRAGADANMLSVPITIGDTEYFATDGTIDGANDDLLTGDQIYIDIDDVPEFGTPANGLSVTLTFE